MIMLLHALAFMSNLVSAAADGCSRDPTEIRVYAKIEPPTTNFSKSEIQLQAMRSSAEIASDPRFAELAGLTVGGISVDFEVRIANMGIGAGTVCAWPSVVTVTLSAAPAIYIAAGRSACQTEAALDHEMRHVAINTDVIARYAPIFKRRVGAMIDAIGTAGPMPEENLSKTRRRIEEKVSASIAVTADEMNEAWISAQHGLDSPAEYARLGHACPEVETRAGSTKIRPDPVSPAPRGNGQP
jgi:hypothetical protein